MQSAYKYTTTPTRKTYQCRLRILAVLTKHIALDKAIKCILQLASVMFSIDDVALVLEVELRLRAQFTAEIFSRIYK